MSANFNRVLLMGNLTRDPITKTLDNGSTVTEASLAVNRDYSDKSGNKRSDVTFVDVVIWGTHGETFAKYTQKGSGIFIEGRLHMDSWKSKDGEKRTKLRVVSEKFQFMSRTNNADLKDNSQSDVDDEF